MKISTVLLLWSTVISSYVAAFYSLIADCPSNSTLHGKRILPSSNGAIWPAQYAFVTLDPSLDQLLSGLGAFELQNSQLSWSILLLLDGLFAYVGPYGVSGGGQALAMVPRTYIVHSNQVSVNSNDYLLYNNSNIWYACNNAVPGNPNPLVVFYGKDDFSYGNTTIANSCTKINIVIENML